MRVLDVFREVTAFLTAIGYGLEQTRRLVSADESRSDSGIVLSRAPDLARELGDDFLLTTSIGFNRQLLANIDAIDAALIGVLGATVAFAVLAIDKILELAVFPRWIAIGFLTVSGLLSFTGYAYGFISGEPIEVPRPVLFVPDFARNGSQAVTRALRATLLASERNRRIRTQKRVIAFVAMALLIGGAGVIAYARLTGAVPASVR